MAKILHCRDAGFDCDATVRGDTVEDILAQVRPHAAEAHQVTVDRSMEQQLAGLVQEA
jgi:predicted small metal-binding protein